MAMTGFDPSLVNSSMNKVESAYTDLMAALKTRMQNDFVNSMANYWACNQAQTFFTGSFKPSVDSLLEGSYKTFESVISAMNSAAQNWANQTDSSWTGRSFNGTSEKIDVSSIKENINGVRGVDETEANNTAGKLSSIASDASSALTSAQQAVQNCGFVGRNQEANLISSLQTIKNNINSSTSEMTEAIKSNINTTVDNYGSLAQSVESAFTTE